MTAKIIIPTTQIQKLEFYDLDCVNRAFGQHRIPVPSYTETNPLYQEPSSISNIRGYLD